TEGFLQQIDSGIKRTVVSNLILRIARHVEHSNLRKQFADVRGQFAAVHPRHDHIGKQQIDSALVTVDDLQSRGAVFGFENLVALDFEILAGEMAKVGFIFDQEDGFLSMLCARQGERFLCGGGVFAAIDSRKISAERGAALRLAVDKNESAALLHDAIYGRKT